MRRIARKSIVLLLCFVLLLSAGCAKENQDEVREESASSSVVSPPVVIASVEESKPREVIATKLELSELSPRNLVFNPFNQNLAAYTVFEGEEIADSQSGEILGYETNSRVFVENMETKERFMLLEREIFLEEPYGHTPPLYWLNEQELLINSYLIFDVNSKELTEEVDIHGLTPFHQQPEMSLDDNYWQDMLYFSYDWLQDISYNNQNDTIAFISQDVGGRKVVSLYDRRLKVASSFDQPSAATEGRNNAGLYWKNENELLFTCFAETDSEDVYPKEDTTFNVYHYNPEAEEATLLEELLIEDRFAVSINQLNSFGLFLGGRSYYYSYLEDAQKFIRQELDGKYIGFDSINSLVIVEQEGFYALYDPSTDSNTPTEFDKTYTYFGDNVFWTKENQEYYRYSV